MKTKMKEYYIEIAFWTMMFVWASLQSEEIFKIDNYVIENPNWLITIWIAGMWTAIKSLFCIDRHKGATKHKKRYYTACKVSVDDIRVKNDIKKQGKQAVKILIAWGVFLVVEGVCYHYNIINEKLIILGTISLRIFDKLFVLVWCPFGAIMRNKCCTTCRIHGWDQLMLNSPLVFIPSVPSYSLILISIIYFIEWEISVKRHPERFSQISNMTIRCTGCHEICGRCRNRYKKL